MREYPVLGILALAVLAYAENGGVYFPLRAVELQVFVDSEALTVEATPAGKAFFRPRVLLDEGGTPQNIRFALSDPVVPENHPKLPWLNIDPQTGVLTVKKHRVVEDHGSPRVYVMWLEATSRAVAPPHRSFRPFMDPPSRARMNITITLVLRKNDAGASFTDTCFWTASEYQVWENMPETSLGLMGNPREGLSIRPVGYQLLNGSEHVDVRQSESGAWELVALADLDRDNLHNPESDPPQRGPGPHLAVHAECRLSSGQTRRAVLRVLILDEDDNPPETEGAFHVEFRFPTEAAMARGAHLVVRDLDSRAANRYSALSVYDPSKLVNHNKLEFDVPHAGVPHTVISIRLTLRETLDDHYTLSIGMTDVTLKEGLDKELRLNVTFFGPPLAPPRALSLRTAGVDESSEEMLSSRTPDEDSPIKLPSRVSISRQAQIYARVAQPKESDDDDAAFDIDPNPFFGVTPVGGIVYVANTTGLLDAPSDISVKVTWKGTGREFHHHLLVHLDTDDKIGKGCEEGIHCSNHGDQKSCESTCGIATGGSNRIRGTRCSWRSPKTTSVMTSDYGTCTHDLRTCPDKVCDPLEQMHDLICPQDCTGQYEA